MTKTSRRNFIKVSALAGGGLMMSITLPGSTHLLDNTSPGSAALNAFLSIAPDGKITFLLTKHEMGQGSGTGLPMILADELGADWNKLSIIRSDYDRKFNWRTMGVTGGSSTISGMWDVLRKAGATAREMLKQAAAKRWEVSTAILKAENNFIVNTENGEKLEFGQLAEAAAQLPVPESVTLKKPEEFVYIGKPVKNLLTEDMAIGKANYGINTDVPGMVYASIEKCPVYKGKLKNFDATEALKVTGVIDVFPMPSFEPVSPDNHVQEGVVVVATSTWAAFKARKALKIEWDPGKFATANIESLKKEMSAVLNGTMDPGYRRGDTDKLKKEEGYEVFEAEYDNPYQAHALMEPINATVHFKGDTCEVWVGTQSGERVTKEVAKVTGLPEDKITTHVLNSGGAFGRRYYCDSSMEAAYISMQIKKPVKVTWSREDEVAHDYFHPYQKSIHRAVISPEKKVVGWETSLCRTEVYASGLNIADIPYDFPNVKTEWKQLESIIHPGAWRSVSEHSSSLGKESFMDELTRKLGKDPVEFRLELLQEEIRKEGNTDDAERVYNYRKLLRERHVAVLNTIKEKGLWNNSILPSGSGKGIAIENFGGTVCAHIAQVSLADNDFGFKVDKVSSVVHCGTLINPHFGKGQIEGSIIWALSALKYGGVEVEKGVVKQRNFHNNRLLKMDEIPEIEIYFIESDEPPSGLGEPGTPPLAPAVLNALFDATGKRIRKIPVTKEDLQANSI
ncbi:molybdopterin cofactor-binding domain-containing protein [Rapidithrix thailandica]|uniref:Molybdopterin cofactor-binding domain-containing protein n=1 Tax=Rapidithrix thailandica TaxID=413964 RepID=A0AAW9SC28_9BACT